MKVFLDVGAHRGQTLGAVLERDFERIVCFEPVSQHWPVLQSLADKRTRIETFGLWNRTASVELLDPGTKGAGMWIKDRRRADVPLTRELCEFRRASDWFRFNLAAGDQVYLKLNCEGCECDILDDLLDSGEFEKVAFTMIEFDVRKISAMRHRQEQVMGRLAKYPPPRVMVSMNAMDGATHHARVHSWLDLLKQGSA